MPLHTLLLSVYPILHLYARNMAYTPLQDTIRSFVVAGAFAFYFLLGFRLVVRGWHKAGVLSSLALVMFFSFGHAVNAVERWSAEGSPVLAFAQLRLLWIAAFVVLAFVVWRWRVGLKTTQLLNGVAACLLAFPLFTAISTGLLTRGVAEADAEALARLRGQGRAEASLPSEVDDEPPDIYYIVFDGYERADLLARYYGYDNAPFLEALERRGFYVVSAGRSNYMNTNYSLNTSLNLVYFHDFPPRLTYSARYNLETNYVSDFLRRQGYRVIVFDSGSRDTNAQYADVFVSPGSGAPTREGRLNAFEQLLLRTTGRLLLPEAGSEAGRPGQAAAGLGAAVNQELDERRQRIAQAFERLADFAALPGPHFLFAHIYLPHVPFLYGAAGQPLDFHGDRDLTWYQVKPDEYLEYYGYQLDYLNRAVLQAIDAVLAGSDGPVVIILQSDHGDEAYLDWEAPTAEGVDVRTAILHAIYFSDGSYAALYPTMTPVNTFRIVFNHWFGTQYPLLEDRVFFHEHPLQTSAHQRPEFLDACAHFAICLPTPPR